MELGYFIGKEPQFTPDMAKRQYRHYKPIAILYRKILIGMSILLAVLIYCLLVTLKGNNTLQNQIPEKSVSIIYPNESRKILVALEESTKKSASYSVIAVFPATRIECAQAVADSVSVAMSYPISYGRD